MPMGLSLRVPHKARRLLGQRYVPAAVRLYFQKRVTLQKLRDEEAGIRERNEPELDYLPNILQPGMNVLDVGANVGRYTVRISRLVGPDGRVVAFEPVALTRKILGFVLNRFRCRNVLVMPMALSDRRDDTIISVPRSDGLLGENLGWASLVPPSGRLVSQHSVVTERYDDLRLPLNKFHFVKCDVEGAELLALKGMRNLLSEQHPALLVEIEDRHCQRFGSAGSDVFAYLKELGYKAYYLDAGELHGCPGPVPGRKNYLFFCGVVN